MYLEEEIKHVIVDKPTVGDLIKALMEFPMDAEIADAPVDIHYEIWSNEESDRERQGYKEYKYVRIE